MTQESTQQKINDRYGASLAHLLERFQSALDETNKMHGTRHGFALMMIRDLSEGNVDLIHNFTKKEDLQRLFEITLTTIKNYSDKQTLNP